MRNTCSSLICFLLVGAVEGFKAYSWVIWRNIQIQDEVIFFELTSVICFQFFEKSAF